MPFLLLLCVLMGCASGAAISLDASPSRGVELRPGVVVDPSRAAAYVALPAGGIEAIELRSGRKLWMSADGALPLAVSGRFLIARAEAAQAGPRLPIVVLDTRSGRARASAVAALPAGVRATISDDARSSFRTSATAVEGGVRVAWTYRETVLEGTAPMPGVPPREIAMSGAVLVEPATGRVSTIERPVAEGRQPAWRVGNVLAETAGGRGDALRLLRRNATTGAPLPERVLLENAITTLVSADRTHVLASARVGSGTPEDPEYQWSIFSLETGERVGGARRNVSAAPFVVWKDTIIFESRPHGFLRGSAWVEEPLALVALPLTGGATRWTRQMRDLEYRGSRPPSQ